MIQKQELRIGNSVMYKGIHYKIISLDHTSCWIEIPNKAFTNREVDYSDLEPIPITEEALVKMGFVKHSEIDYRFSLKVGHDSDFITYDLDDNMYSIHDSWINTRIKYVHQLCNLIYAITQTELSYD